MGLFMQTLGALYSWLGALVRKFRERRFRKISTEEVMTPKNCRRRCLMKLWNTLLAWM